MKRKALFMTLSGKVADEQFMVLDSVKLEDQKTKKAAKILNTLALKLKNYKVNKAKKDNLLLVVAKKDLNLDRSTRNLDFVKLTNAKDLNVLDVLSHKFLLIDQSSIPVLKENFKL